MAQLTSTSININGINIRQFSSFSLLQGIYQHHSFRLICAAEAIDGPAGIMFSQTKDLMGATLSAQVSTMNGAGTLQFKGIVTQVQAEKYSGSNGDVVISGYSATILLDSGPHCKSWEKKAVKNIVQDVLKHFPQNVLNPKIAPVFPETLAYFVQYQETAWRFLSRICSTYGEWLYFDGTSLQVGIPSADKTVSLGFGNNLSRFNISLQVKPPGMQSMAYDYLNNEVYTSNPSGIEDKAGLNELGKKTYQARPARLCMPAPPKTGTITTLLIKNNWMIV